MASLPRIRRVVIASVPAWATSSRLSSELYAICSRVLAGPVQPQSSPSSMVVDAWAGGCTCGRNASLGEPAAYQARSHRSGDGMDSVRPLE